MACERYRDALTDVATGMPATGAVEAHLASCDACRAELQVLRRALALADAEMAELASAEPPPGLTARIRQAVKGTDASSPALNPEPALAWPLGWLWPAMAAAATLLVALVVVMERGTTTVGEPRVAVDAARPRPTGRTPVAEPPSAPVIPKDSGQTGPEGSAGTADPSWPADDVAPRDDTPRLETTDLPPAVTRRDERRAPEVLVPRGETEALLRFVALVHRQGLAPTSLAAAGQPSADLAELASIDIKPLEIVPLDPAETSGT